MLAASEVLGALTPGDIAEAVDDMRLGLTREERTATVTRIVRRRQRTSVRDKKCAVRRPAFGMTAAREIGGIDEAMPTK